MRVKVSLSVNNRELEKLRNPCDVAGQIFDPKWKRSNSVVELNFAFYETVSRATEQRKLFVQKYPVTFFRARSEEARIVDFTEKQYGDVLGTVSWKDALLLLQVSTVRVSEEADAP